MAENAGIIYAEIRLKIDEFKRGAVDVQKFVKNLETELKKVERKSDTAGKKINKSGKETKDFSEMVKHATNNVKVFGVSLNQLGGFGTAIAAIVAAFKALSGFIAEAQKKSEDLTKSLRSQRAVSENLGISYRQLSQKMQNAMEVLEQEQEKAQRATGALDAVLQKAGMAFDLLKAKGQQGLGTVVEFLGNLTGGYIGATTAEKESANALKKYAEQYSSLEAAAKRYGQAYNNIMSAEYYGLIQSEEGNARRVAAAEEYIQQLIEIKNNLDKSNAAYAEQNTQIDTRIKSMMNVVKRNTEDTKTQAKEVNLLTQAEEAYNKTLAQIENQKAANYLKDGEYESKRLQAEQQYIQTLSGLRTEYRQLGTMTEEQETHIAAVEAARIAEAKALETVIAYQTEYAGEMERLRTGYEEVSAEMGNETTLAELMATEHARLSAEIEKQQEAELAAVEARYAAIAAQREDGRLTEEEITHREELTEAINRNHDAMQKLADTQAVTAAKQKIVDYAKEIENNYKTIMADMAEQEILSDKTLTDYEKQLAVLELQRQAALDELNARYAVLEAERGLTGLLPEEISKRDRLTEAINKNFDAMKKLQGEAKKTSLFDSDAFKAGMQIGESAVSAFSDIASAMTEITQQQAQEVMAEIDRMLEETRSKIEEERTAALEAEGFIEATNSESIQAQIDAAREANDEILQYQLERRQRELAINEEYDAKVKAEEEKAAHDKAMIEYDAAEAKYTSDITSAIVNGALAITQAANNMWPLPAIPMMAAAGTATGAQMAVILANPPKMPKFADGGIVPGQPHANRDTVAAMLSPGELILNRAQQENLVPQIGGDLYIDLIYDGERVSKMVVENYINKGRALIDASRGIR
jgi:hypothetical protein